jgi:hypothetical protein
MACELRTRLRAALLLGGLLLAGCDQWALSVGGNGLIFIGVTGDDHPGRFRVRARQADGTRLLDMPASGELNLSGLAPGAVELTLLLPPGCRVAGANPQTLTITPDQPARAAFEVRCSPESAAG